ncbi:TauD/TfdA dioxygenase family protein [Novosphingobium resinovorum]|uniref:TauD/TfdA dioxygenase family protein n=1 Tax=Novosphingobium resinovorum TaxID=158500 RepID=UPI002ED2A72E|nr:TauD/TfdA family dioxygenase [Novosphingobium resinovorum]
MKPEGVQQVDYSAITVTPLTPGMGGIVSGVDLTQPLSNSVVDELHRALEDRLVIFFRDQPIDHEAHKRFANYFGGIHIAPSTKPWQAPGHPEVTIVHADADSTFVAGEDWHSDMSCDDAPPLGSVLYLHTVPPVGGDTAFSNMYAAYDALSDRMKTHLGGLTAVHDAVAGFGGITPEGMKLPRNSHPVIRTHPTTGRKSIYVNKSFTTHIEGIPRAESEALLGYLFQHVQHPMFQCRFSWQPHSIAFWDNRCAQHSAIWDYFPQVRSGFRVQILGDVPR